jgi:hypothetical protein
LVNLVLPPSEFLFFFFVFVLFMSSDYPHL